MSEPKKRRRKRDEVEASGDATPEGTAGVVIDRALVDEWQRRWDALPADQKALVEGAINARRVDALLEESRRAEREELGAMLDERFTSLLRDIDAKVDEIMTRLSREVEKLSMRAVEVGDVALPTDEPLSGEGQTSRLAEIWWEHVGHQWPTLQEELSLQSIEGSVAVVATTHRLHSHDLLVRVLQLYAADRARRVVGESEPASAIHLQLHLHEYMGRAVEMTLAELGEASS